VSRDKAATQVNPVEGIASAIIVLRGHRVLLDEALAGLYCVETKALVQAVKRNSSRFPPDFMFQLTTTE
jgi:ABC-type branched-subunit amino acid transport system ATPase component